MGAAEHWDDLVISLVDIRPGSARRRFRRSILAAWGSCAYCGRACGDGGEPLELSLDHVRPRSRGGGTFRRNLVAACLRCNHNKASSDWIEWFTAQSYWDLGRQQRIEAWLSGETDMSIDTSDWEERDGRQRVEPGAGGLPASAAPAGRGDEPSAAGDGAARERRAAAASGECADRRDPRVWWGGAAHGGGRPLCA